MNLHARQSPEDPSVSVAYPGFWRRLFAFSGPAYLVSVGYMDPGNWATDLEGGARFGYELVWVLLASNLVAVFLQALSTRLGIVSGQDLAQACHDSYPRPLNVALWILCELAVAACDLAEVIGTVIGLNLLFGLTPLVALLLTGFDTFLFLALQRFGVRKLEAFVLALVAVVGACFVLEIALAQPAWTAVASGLLPSFQRSTPFLFSSDEALYVAIGILGATVMPHNLYLHSALVQTRQIEHTSGGLRQACRYNLVDSIVALNLAFLVNAAILVLAGTAFHNHAEIEQPLQSVQLQDAYHLLHRILGTSVAPVAFAIALIAAGLSSTITGTLAGQVVMEGFLRLRMTPWVRRLLTRLVAITPAFVAIQYVGPRSMTSLLILSQVILSLQLPFAIVPLLQFTSDPARMGELANPRWVRVLGWLAVTTIVALNARLVQVQFEQWFAMAGAQAFWFRLVLLPVAAAVALLFAWLIVYPHLASQPRVPTRIAVAKSAAEAVMARLSEPDYRRIGVAVDHTVHDEATLRHAASLARAHQARLIVLHVVEGVGSDVHGSEDADIERRADEAYLQQVCAKLVGSGLSASAALRFGNPASEIIRSVKDEKLDLLVLGSHGHGWFADWLFGETIRKVRHSAAIPVFVVREPALKPPK